MIPYSDPDPYRIQDAYAFAARERDDVRPGAAPAYRPDEPATCPACGAACTARDLGNGGKHYRYFNGQCDAQIVTLEALEGGDK